MILPYLINFVLIVVFVTLLLIFIRRSNKKGIYISLIGLAIGIGIPYVLNFVNKNKNEEYLNSRKSSHFLRVEHQFEFLNGESVSVVNKFIKVKLDKFILNNGLKDSISYYAPKKTFNSFDIKKIESATLHLSNKFLELNPENYNIKQRKIKEVNLELVSSNLEDTFVLILRGITNDSTTVFIKSIFDPKLNELVIINLSDCILSDKRWYVSDVKNELLFYCSLENCSLKLRSKCCFVHTMNDYYHNGKNFQNRIFSLNKNATFLIDGKVYPSYRLYLSFNYIDLLKIKLKPTTIVEW